MAETYDSPTLSFMLSVGLRTKEANLMWTYLNEMSHSSVWVMSGAYLRHARMQRGALAQQVAQAQHPKKGGHRGKGRGKGKQSSGNGKHRS